MQVPGADPVFLIREGGGEVIFAEHIGQGGHG